MKKFKILSFLMVLISAISFTSCDTEPIDSALNNTGGTGNTGGPASFKVNFGGNTYVANNPQAMIMSGSITIAGVRGTGGESVNLVIPATTVGTYTNALMTYNTGSTTNLGQYANINPAMPQMPNGSVKITNIDTVNKKISGTFSFTGYWSEASANLPSLAFTDGTFTNIPYTGTVGPTPEVPVQQYSAKIDGTTIDYSDDITVASSGGFMVILGLTDAPDSMNIRIKQTLTPGTYPITTGLMDDVTAQFSNPSDSFEATSGTLTIISKANGWIKGTFSFVTGVDGVGVHQVTDGTFNVEY